MLKLVFSLGVLLAVCAAQQPNYLDADYGDYQEQVHRPQPVARPAPRAIQSRPVAASVPRTTPVPILKQINKHNDDGSYTYGFEGADGTFKIETKFANGEVKGKYGFVDDTGKVRTVEYGADRYGFQPAGEGITVAPPTYVDETLTEEPEFDEYRPRPAPQQRVQQQQRVKAAPRPRPQPQPQYQPQYDDAPPQGGNFEQQTTYHSAPQYQVQEEQEAPRRPAPVPQRPLSIPGAAPVPQRPAISGAIPAPVQRNSAPPAALRQTYAAPAPRPVQIPGAFQAPDPVRPRAQQPVRANPSSPRAGPSGPQQFYQAAPQVHHQPIVQQHQQQPQQPRSFQAPRAAHGSVLDQLAKDYALPQNGGASIHDFSFSSGF